MCVVCGRTHGGPLDTRASLSSRWTRHGACVPLSPRSESQRGLASPPSEVLVVFFVVFVCFVFPFLFVVFLSVIFVVIVVFVVLFAFIVVLFVFVFRAGV